MKTLNKCLALCALSLLLSTGAIADHHHGSHGGGHGGSSWRGGGHHHHGGGGWGGSSFFFGISPGFYTYPTYYNCVYVPVYDNWGYYIGSYKQCY